MRTVPALTHHRKTIERGETFDVLNDPAYGTPEQRKRQQKTITRVTCAYQKGKIRFADTGEKDVSPDLICHQCHKRTCTHQNRSRPKPLEQQHHQTSPAERRLRRVESGAGDNIGYSDTAI